MDDFTRQLEIQRIVDDRMDSSELAMFVEWLDDHPEHWREFALAFVEDRALRQSLVETNRPRATAETSRALGRKWPSMTAAVAMLLCGFAAGWTSTRFSGPADPETATESAGSPELVLVQMPGESPTVPTPRPRPAFAVAPLIEDDSRAALQRDGFDVFEEQIVYVVEDASGNRYLVPERHVTFTSH